MFTDLKDSINIMRRKIKAILKTRPNENAEVKMTISKLNNCWTVLTENQILEKKIAVSLNSEQLK